MAEVMEYPKIQTLFLRDSKNIIIPDRYTLPEFETLKNVRWEATEKVDGTNIRIELVPVLDSFGDLSDTYMYFKGRTDKAQIPNHLFLKLQQLFPKEKLLKEFPVVTSEGTHVTIFGEGYGSKIQNGGNYIKDDVSFILFDVKIGKWWLTRESCEQVAKALGIDIVPLIGHVTIPEAIDYVRKGFKSIIAQNKDYDAEGLVLKAPYGLLRRNGERLITKIKTVDFRKYEANKALH